MILSPQVASVVKRFLMLSVLVTALVFTVNAKTASTAPCRELWTDYYSDPELTQWCGWKYNSCSQIYREGCQRTGYQINYTGDCCDGGNNPGGPLCDC